jgi:hypothetical protein
MKSLSMPFYVHWSTVAYAKTADFFVALRLVMIFNLQRKVDFTKCKENPGGEK